MALRFLIDEDFDNDILRGVLRKKPDLDIVRVQDVGLSGASDPVVLEWAAQQGRILFTHDVSTMKGYAFSISGRPRKFHFPKKIKKLLRLALLCDKLTFHPFQQELAMCQSTRRSGFSLIDVVVLIGILLLGLALFFPVMNRIREKAKLTQTQNNISQMVKAVHVHDEAQKIMPPAYGEFPGGKFVASAHVHLLPYLEQAPLYDMLSEKRKGAEQTKIPVFLSPLDTSTMGDKTGGVQNFAANLRVFSAKAWKQVDKNIADLKGIHPTTGTIQAACIDGTSNVMMFTTKFGVCGEGGSRFIAEPASKFAAFFGQNLATVKAHPSDEKATFQLSPGPKECRFSPLMAQSFSRPYLTVGLGDGSVRSVHSRVSPQSWNAALVPNDRVNPGGDF